MKNCKVNFGRAHFNETFNQILSAVVGGDQGAARVRAWIAWCSRQSWAKNNKGHQIWQIIRFLQRNLSRRGHPWLFELTPDRDDSSEDEGCRAHTKWGKRDEDRDSEGDDDIEKLIDTFSSLLRRVGTK